MGNKQKWICPRDGHENYGEACDICQYPRPRTTPERIPISVIVAGIASVIAVIAVIVALTSRNTETKTETVTVYVTPAPTTVVVQSTPAPTVAPTLTPVATAAPTAAPVVKRSVITTEIPRSAREYQNHYFKQWKINYNVFTTGEVTDCFAVHIDYSCSLKDANSGKSATGTRVVYARDYANEIAGNDDAWIAVGTFEYNKTNGAAVSVDLNWDSTIGPIDIYAMAIDRDDKDAGTSYNASWGAVTTLYSYSYSYS